MDRINYKFIIASQKKNLIKYLGIVAHQLIFFFRKKHSVFSLHA